MRSPEFENIWSEIATAYSRTRNKTALLHAAEHFYCLLLRGRTFSVYAFGGTPMASRHFRQKIENWFLWKGYVQRTRWKARFEYLDFDAFEEDRKSDWQPQPYEYEATERLPKVDIAPVLAISPDTPLVERRSSRVKEKKKWVETNGKVGCIVIQKAKPSKLLPVDEHHPTVASDIALLRELNARTQRLSKKFNL